MIFSKRVGNFWRKIINLVNYENSLSGNFQWLLSTFAQISWVDSPCRIETRKNFQLSQLVFIHSLMHADPQPPRPQSFVKVDLTLQTLEELELYFGFWLHWRIIWKFCVYILWSCISIWNQKAVNIPKNLAKNSLVFVRLHILNPFQFYVTELTSIPGAGHPFWREN